jgi:hypothetical protein
MTRIQKNSNPSNLFSTPDKPFSEHVPELKKDLVKAKQRDDSWKKIENQRTKKSTYNDLTYANENKILNAGKGEIKDNISTNKYMGYDNNNSIWDTNKISDRSKLKSNSEITKEQKETEREIKNSFRSERLNDMLESLQSTDLRKASNISSLSSQESTNHKRTTGISVLDDSKDFSRVSGKTDGEKLVEANRKKKEERKEKLKNDRVYNALPQKLKSKLI